MELNVVGKRFRLAKPVRALVGDARKGRIVRIEGGAMLWVREVSKVVTGLLVADWEGRQVWIFEEDLAPAIDVQSAEFRAAPHGVQ